MHVVGQGGEGRRDKSTKKTAESGFEEELGGTVKAEAAQRRVKEYQHIAAEGEINERNRARRKTSGCTNNKNEFEQQQRGTGMFKQQWRRNENKKLQSKQWIQQSGQQEKADGEHLDIVQQLRVNPRAVNFPCSFNLCE